MDDHGSEDKLPNSTKEEGKTVMTTSGKESPESIETVGVLVNGEMKETDKVKPKDHQCLLEPSGTPEKMPMAERQVSSRKTQCVKSVKRTGYPVGKLRSSHHVKYKENLTPSCVNSKFGRNRYPLRSQYYHVIRQRMRDLRLLRATPASFELPMVANEDNVNGEHYYQGTLLEQNGMATSQRPMRRNSNRRKTLHAASSEFVDEERDRLKQGKALIAKMPPELVEECDIVRTALFLTFCDLDCLESP